MPASYWSSENLVQKYEQNATKIWNIEILNREYIIIAKVNNTMLSLKVLESATDAMVPFSVTLRALFVSNPADE